MLPLHILLAPLFGLALSHSNHSPAVPIHSSDLYFPKQRPVLGSRQSGNVCPNNSSLSCIPPQLCCPRECCPTSQPFCFSDSICMDKEGFTTCSKTATGLPVVSLFCRNDPEFKCCSQTTAFRFCTDDTPVRCVDENGYIECGQTDPEPGVSCEDLPGGEGLCCRLPRRCCIKDGKQSCCDVGTGGPRRLQPFPTDLVPAATPGIFEPSPSVDPTSMPSSIRTPTPSTAPPLPTSPTLAPSALASSSPSSASQTPPITDSFPSPGTCPAPNEGRTCVKNTLCCSKQCCSPLLPFCFDGFCMDSDGRTVCQTKNNEDVISRLCRTSGKDGNYTCCGGSDPGYPFCPIDEPYDCLNADGFMNCNGQPGVSCSDDKCCQNPKTCCGEFCCDENGTGGPRILEGPPTELEAANTPAGVTISPHPSQTLSASRSPSLSPSKSQSAAPSASNLPLGTPVVSDRASCFPASGKVELEDGRTQRMDEVQTGQRVLVGNGQYSELFLWSHRDARHRSSNYIALRLGGMLRFTAAQGHLIYVCRGAAVDCDRKVVRVEDIKVGDGVWTVRGVGETVEVVQERWKTSETGLYNPHTVHGDIVVDGVVATCYTRFVALRVAHSALAPVRGMYAVVAAGMRWSAW